MVKNKIEKGNGLYLIFCSLFFAFIFSMNFISASYGYNNPQNSTYGYDNSQIVSGKGGSSGNTTIFQNITNTYINQTLNITNNITNNITYPPVNVFDQWLNTTSNVIFNNLSITGNLSANYFYGNGYNLTSLLLDIGNTTVKDGSNLTFNDVLFVDGAGKLMGSNFFNYQNGYLNLTQIGSTLPLFVNGGINITGSVYSSGINLTALNSSGLIQDWNNTGLLINWSQVPNSYVTNSTGLLMNWSNQPSYTNVQNFLTNTSSIFSYFFNNTFYLNSNPLNFINTSDSIFSYFSNSTFYLNSNPSGFISTISADARYAPIYWNPFNQVLNTTGNVTFANANITGSIFGNNLCYTNGTGCPASSGLTNGSSAWLQSLAIGTTNFNLFDASNPAILSINSSGSKEGINLEGNINDFFEANIANINMGNASQACWTSTTNAENLTFNFISMCANNGNFTNQTPYNVGFGNDTSLMGFGLGDMYIDQAQPNKDLFFMNGGTNASNQSQIAMMINGSNNNFIGIGTSNPQSALEINNSKPLQFDAPLKNNINADGTVLTTSSIYWNNSLFINQGGFPHFNDTTYQLLDSATKSNIMTIDINNSGFTGDYNSITFGYINNTPGNFSNGLRGTAGMGIVNINHGGSELYSGASALIVQDLPPYSGTYTLAEFLNGRVGFNTSSPTATLSAVGTFSIKNESLKNIIITGNINYTGTLAGINANVTYINFGNLINLTSLGAVALPPFTGAGVAVCSNSTNPTFAGTMMKNTSGVYGCPVAGGNWLKLF